MSSHEPSRGAVSEAGCPGSVSGPGLKCFCAVLALLLVASFPWVLGGARSFFYRDYGVIALPFVQFHHDQFWAGNPLPLWNPLSNCGAPFLAQWGTMVLYPFSLIYLVLPLPWSLGVFSLAHLFVGGVGMYRLAIRWSGDGGAAAVAGVGFAFSGFVLSSLVWPNYQVALGWMPWVVLLAERAGRDGGRCVPAAALVAALQLLAGVPEVTLLTWVAIVALGAMSVPGTQIGWGRWGVRLGCVVVLAAGLCAAQLLPFLDLLAFSQREVGMVTTKWSMPVWGWGHFLVPLFHAFITPQWTWFLEGQEFVSSYYLGMGILLPALAAGALVPGRRVICLLGLATFGVLLALGEKGLVLPLVKTLLPGVGIARYPIKAMALVTFVVPLLAALSLAQMRALDAVQRQRALRILAVVAGFVLLGIGVVIWRAKANPFPYDQWGPMCRNAAGRAVCLVVALGCALGWARLSDERMGRWVLCGLLAVLVADGWTHWPNLAPTMPSGNLAAGLAREALGLKPAPLAGQSRVMIVPAAEKKLLRSGVSNWEADFLGKRRALWSNLNALDGMAKVNGSSTLQIRQQAAVQDLLYATPDTDLPRLLDFLAVSHVTKPGAVVEWTERPEGYAFVSAGRQPVFADAAATLKALAGDGFDPQRSVYVEESQRSSLQAEADPGASAQVKMFSAEHVVVEVQSERPVLLTVAQTMHHPWRARVDGIPAALVRANHAFQGVAVPSGRHEVRLDYVDVRFRLGACISVLTLVLLAGLWWWMRPRPA